MESLCLSCIDYLFIIKEFVFQKTFGDLSHPVCSELTEVKEHDREVTIQANQALEDVREMRFGL